MSTNKTIAKNTLFLYFRMFITMGVSLYTSRIVLSQLGVSNYGIYGVVGGFVAMFGFFNNAMASATQRFLSFGIGKGDFNSLQKTFSIALTIHIGIAFLVLILAESIGLWYINNMMVFPEGRAFSVNIVYQLSILTALVGIIQVPYNALIIAREHMKIYAYISILEVVLKLSAIFLLIWFSYDKLVVYSILVFLVSLIIRLIFQFYCKKNFKESKYKFEYDKIALIEILSYTGWNSLGSIALLICSQGNNLILNYFFGTNVNAAFGITMQVQSAILAFIQNFQTAVNPQIVKNYAKNNLGNTYSLIIKSTKFSFYLLLVIIVPIFYNIDFILKLWLNIVPEYTVIFVKCSLIYVLIEILSFSLVTGIQATGKIKYFQIILGALVFMNFPLSFLVVKIGNSPESIFLILIVISIVAFCCRLYFAKKLLNLQVDTFAKNIIFPIFLVLTLSFFMFKIIIILGQLQLNTTNFYDFLSNSIFLIVLLMFSIYLLGIDKNERELILTKIKSKFK